MRDDLLVLARIPMREGEDSPEAFGAYPLRALVGCRNRIREFRRACGEEPAGACLTFRRLTMAHGGLYEVVCRYDGEDAAASAYVARCAREAPRIEVAHATEPAVCPARGRA